MRSLDEIRAALAVEREIMGDRGGRVPVDEIKARAGFYPSNDERSAVEIADFREDVPARYFAYRSRDLSTITTWTGEEIARVFWRGRVWTSNMGDRRQAFRAHAVNGADYAGIAYLDSGDYVRMRKLK